MNRDVSILNTPPAGTAVWRRELAGLRRQPDHARSFLPIGVRSAFTSHLIHVLICFLQSGGAHPPNPPLRHPRIFRTRRRACSDVISLGVGEPDFATPWHIREAAIYSLEKGETCYTSNLGLLDAAQGIAEIRRRNSSASLRSGDGDHRHRRRERGARPRVPRAAQSRRRGASTTSRAT